MADLQVFRDAENGSLLQPREIVLLATSPTGLDTEVTLPLTNSTVHTGDGDVLLLVGCSSGLPTAAYRCPVYLVLQASTTLSSLVEDLVEAEAELAPSQLGGEPSVARSVPLPFAQQERFETVALYWEHFYGVSSDRIAPPTALSTPLQLPELYSLSSWEVQFVMVRLLKLPTRSAVVGNIVTCEWLSQQGRWADATGASRHTGAKPLEPYVAGSTAAAAFSGQLFSLAEHCDMMHELCAVMELCTQLGSAHLQRLCGALIANMVRDASEAEVRQLLAPPGSTKAVPAFTEERKAALLQKHTWLKAVVEDCSLPSSAELKAAESTFAMPATST